LSDSLTTNYNSIVGAVISRKRSEEGLNQSDLAEAVGVGISTWSRIENGDGSCSIEQLKLACEKLNCTLVDIINAVEDSEKHLIEKGFKVKINSKSSELKSELKKELSNFIPILGTTLIPFIYPIIVHYLFKNKDSEK